MGYSVLYMQQRLGEILSHSDTPVGIRIASACSLMQEIAEYPLMVYQMMVRCYELSGDRAYLAILWKSREIHTLNC